MWDVLDGRSVNVATTFRNDGSPWHSLSSSSTDSRRRDIVVNFVLDFLFGLDMESFNGTWI